MNDSPTRMIIHPHFPPDIEFQQNLLQLQLDHEMHLPPSENTVFKWLFAVNATNHNNSKPVIDEDGTRLSGDWLIFKSLKEVDHAWDIVKSATESGLLGYESFVRTAKYQEGELCPENKVIGVSTYNAYDEADVCRVRGALWDLGFTSAHNVKEGLKYEIHAVTDCHVDNIEDQDDCVPMYQY